METETTKWIGKHGPILFSISSNFLQAPLLLCNNEPDHPVSPFVSALKGSTTQRKAWMKENIFEIELVIF